MDDTSLKNESGCENRDLDSNIFYCVYHLLVSDRQEMRVLAETLREQRLRVLRVTRANSI